MYDAPPQQQFPAPHQSVFQQPAQPFYQQQPAQPFVNEQPQTDFNSQQTTNAYESNYTETPAQEQPTNFQSTYGAPTQNQENYQPNYQQNYQESYQQNYYQPNYQQPNYNYQQNSYGQQQPNFGYQRLAQPQPNTKKGLAITSLILGIAGMVLCGLLGVGPVLGLIFGIVGLKKAKNEPQEYGGSSLAITGIVLNGVSLVIALMFLSVVIPNIMAARRFANEASAIRSMQMLHSAEEIYKEKNNKFGTVQELSTAQLIDSDLAKGEKNGYRFTINASQDSCDIYGTPLSTSSGNRSFYMSCAEGVIRAANKRGSLADENDPPLGSETSSNSPTFFNGINESAAISSLKTLHAAEMTYQATEGNGRFGTLKQLGQQNLIDRSLASGTKHGYQFIVTFQSDSFEIRATPLNTPTNARSFYLSADGVIRGASKQGGSANATDPPLDY
jgi:competence protein ComGC